MILWCDGGHGARENMRRDESLLRRADAAGEGSLEAEPVLRLFRFAPPGITLGRAQAPDRTLDLERCAADAIEWAVRPTGGRAIFHDEEWTYSFVCRIDDPEWGGNLAQAYARVSELIHDSLATLGLPVALAASRSSSIAPAPLEGGSPEPATDRARPSCFATTARHEIELEGRKFVGSAQRRTSCALLQQGSVLLGDSHLRLADYLRVTGPMRESARAALAQNAQPGGAWLGSNQGLARWDESLTGILGARARHISGSEGACFVGSRGAGSLYSHFC